MTKKEYLKQGIRLKKEIEHDKEVLEELKTILYSLQGIGETERVQGGPLKDDGCLVNKINKVAEIEEKIKNKIIKLNTFQEKLLAELEKISNIDEKILLESRYILNLSWEEIADKICYSLSHTYRIHGNALKNFKMIVNDSKKYDII